MTWGEDDSALFIDEGKYFVPEREAQIATIAAAFRRPTAPRTSSSYAAARAC